MVATEDSAGVEEHLVIAGCRSGEKPPPCPSSQAADDRIAVMGLLIEVHAKLVRIVGDELERACGLPLSWFEVLVRLRRSPDDHLTMSQVATGASLSSGGVTRLVDRIVEAGYVERQDCPSDRRSVFVTLTPAGLQKFDEALPVYAQSIERHVAGLLDPGERDALEASLCKLRGNGFPRGS